MKKLFIYFLFLSSLFGQDINYSRIRSGPGISVAAYGAIPNSSATSTTGFTNAFAALGTNGGRIFSPGPNIAPLTGCYKIGKLSFPSYPKTVIFEGDSSTSTCFIPAAANQTLFALTSPIVANFTSPNNTLKNFSIKAHASGASSSFPAIQMDGMNRTLLENFTYFSNGSGNFDNLIRVNDTTSGLTAGYANYIDRMVDTAQNGPLNLVSLEGTANPLYITRCSVSSNSSGINTIFKSGPGTSLMVIEKCLLEGNSATTPVLAGPHVVIRENHFEANATTGTHYNIDADGTAGVGSQGGSVVDNDIIGLDAKLNLSKAVNWRFVQNTGSLEPYFLTPATSPVNSVFQFGSVFRNIVLGSIAGGFRATQIQAPGFYAPSSSASSPGLTGSHTWYVAAYDGNDGHTIATNVGQLALGATPSTVSIRWTPVNGAKEYHVFRCPSTVLGTCDSTALLVSTVYSSAMCGLTGGCAYFFDNGTITPAGEARPTTDTTGYITGPLDVQAGRNISAAGSLLITGTSTIGGTAQFNGSQLKLGTYANDNCALCVVKTISSSLGPQIGAILRPTSSSSATTFTGVGIDTTLGENATATQLNGLEIGAPTKNSGATVTNAATLSIRSPTSGATQNYTIIFPNEAGGGKKVLCLDNNGGLTFVTEGNCH